MNGGALTIAPASLGPLPGGNPTPMNISTPPAPPRRLTTLTASRAAACGAAARAALSSGFPSPPTGQQMGGTPTLPPDGRNMSAFFGPEPVHAGGGGGLLLPRPRTEPPPHRPRKCTAQAEARLPPRRSARLADLEAARAMAAATLASEAAMRAAAAPPGDDGEEASAQRRHSNRRQARGARSEARRCEENRAERARSAERNARRDAEREQREEARAEQEQAQQRRRRQQDRERQQRHRERMDAAAAGEVNRRRRAAAANNRDGANRAATQPITDEADVPEHNAGGRTFLCPDCGAKLFRDERTLSSICCHKGRVCPIAAQFPQPPPEPIKTLLTGANPPQRTARFRNNLRLYNCTLQMASSGLHLRAPPGGISMLCIQGTVHHLLGPLLPRAGNPEQFAQLYIIDDASTMLSRRLAAVAGGNANNQLDDGLLAELQQCLMDNNRYVRQFRQVCFWQRQSC
jgi:hypothetical protein